MSEMKRLLVDPIAPELAELLRSAELDTPGAPEERQGRILAAIAVAPATALAKTARPAHLDRLWSVAKWGLPVAGLVVAGVAVTSVRSSPAPSAPAPASTFTSASASMSPESARAAGVATSALVPASNDTNATDTSPAATLRVEDLPSAVVDPQGARRRAEPPARAAKGTTGAASASPELVDEIAIIDQARGALAAHRPADTLAQLKGYRTTFTSPHFSEEADALEIQALAAIGRTDEARRKAEQFLAMHAQSPYAQRVRSAAGIER